MSSRHTPVARLSALLVLLLAGCGGSVGTGRQASDSTDPGTGDTPAAGQDYTPVPVASSPGNTFQHPASIGGPETSAREALARMEQQGPPIYSAHVHSCRKVSYATVGRVLAGFGVDMSATGDTSAGQMYSVADQALGAPNYGARVPETTQLTAASASRLFDIFVQAAPEIIANLPTVDRCMVGSTGPQLFDSAGHCSRDGLTCLLGTPATDAHIALCNDIVARAATPDEGQRIAVASLLAAAYTCE